MPRDARGAMAMIRDGHMGLSTRSARRKSIAALLADTAGNTMLMMAAAMFPIIGMAGSAFDMSRAYMVKSRLQQACDAGVLAGRRAMTADDFDEDAAAEEQADRFFEFNFPDDSFGTADVTFEPSGSVDGEGANDGQVTGVASVEVPMVLMHMFGVDDINLTVDCDAKLEVTNTDVMFVLDVTGSMNCAVGEVAPACPDGNNGNVEKSTSKIKALRLAVVDFAEILEESISAQARLRFGFVPYSSTVNVGGLLPADYLVNNHDYQSRVANFNTPFQLASVGSATPEEEVFHESMDRDDCEDRWSVGALFTNNLNGNTYPASPTTGGGPAPATTYTYSYSHMPGGQAEWGWAGAPDTGGPYRSCRRQKYTTPTTYQTKYKFTNWTYKQVSYNVSSFKTGTAVAIVNGDGIDKANSWVSTAGPYNALQLAQLPNTNLLTTTSYIWNGCIEERKTVPNATFPTIPSDAFDLQIDLAPTSDETRWRPMWQQLVFNRNTGNTSLNPETTGGDRSQPSVSCVPAAQRLEEMDSSDVFDYVNDPGFRAIGSTYHDFGMIWGARLISPEGIFGADNLEAPNGKPINRHVVFMSDGQMQPNFSSVYGLQAYERLDRRVSGGYPNNADLTSRHNSRFSAICEALKAKNITVWVVAYGTELSDEMENCADEGRSFTADDDAALREQFETIASRIAELRLAS